ISVAITAADGIGFPGLVKPLRRIRERNIRLIGLANTPQAVGFSMMDASHVIPHADKNSFIPEMLRICNQERVDVLVSIAPWELKKLSNNISVFENAGVAVPISSPKSLRVSMDKHLTFKHCEKIGVPVPSYYSVKDLKTLVKAARDLGYPENEICFKPAMSAGSRGFRIIKSGIDRLKILLEYESGCVYMDIDELCSTLRSVDSFPEMLIMEYLPGDEYSVDVLADNSKALLVIPRTRRKVAMGASISGEIVKNDTIIGYSTKVVESMGLNGVVGLQFKADASGTFKMLEVNPRPHGALSFSTAAGANLLYLSIKLALGEKVKLPSVKWGTKIHRYFSEGILK
ncbi:hypothetical protein LCGC14_2696550, partial [marine sediment metagenome]